MQFVYAYIMKIPCSLDVIEIGIIESIVRTCSVRSVQPVKATATEIPPTVPSMNANYTNYLYFKFLCDVLVILCLLVVLTFMFICLGSRTGGKARIGINGMFSYEYCCCVLFWFLEIQWFAG